MYTNVFNFKQKSIFCHSLENYFSKIKDKNRSDIHN